MSSAIEQARQIAKANYESALRGSNNDHSSSAVRNTGAWVDLLSSGPCAACALLQVSGKKIQCASKRYSPSTYAADIADGFQFPSTISCPDQE
jgi:hypothetical protein